jgi:hypothetical protein
MAVANFYNSSKKISEFAIVSVSKVSRELESFKGECFINQFTKRKLLKSVLLLDYGVL